MASNAYYRDFERNGRFKTAAIAKDTRGVKCIAQPSKLLSCLNELVNETLQSSIIPRLPINLTSPSVMSIACISACRDDYQLTCLEICFHGAHAFQVCRKTQSSLASNITITFVITRHYTYRIDHGERERMCIINQPCSEPICFRSLFFFIKLRAFLKINALNPAKQFVIEEIHCY